MDFVQGKVYVIRSDKKLRIPDYLMGVKLRYVKPSVVSGRPEGYFIALKDIKDSENRVRYYSGNTLRYPFTWIKEINTKKSHLPDWMLK